MVGFGFSGLLGHMPLFYPCCDELAKAGLSQSRSSRAELLAIENG
jgi:hypothetical protein